MHRYCWDPVDLSVGANVGVGSRLECEDEGQLTGCCNLRLAVSDYVGCLEGNRPRRTYKKVTNNIIHILLSKQGCQVIFASTSRKLAC
jgi:hypothetical protein